MRKIFLIILIFSLLSCNNEDNSQPSYNEFYEIHENDKDVITFNMFPFIFKLFIDKSNKETKEAVDEIDKIKFLINENADARFIKDLNDHLPHRLYQTILTVNEGSAKVRFLIREKDGIANELIMIVEESKTCVIMNIDGNFNIKNVKNLSEKINVDDIIKYRL